MSNLKTMALWISGPSTGEAEIFPYPSYPTYYYYSTIERKAACN
jgi:hypothetical protein